MMDSHTPPGVVCPGGLKEAKGLCLPAGRSVWGLYSEQIYGGVHVL